VARKPATNASVVVADNDPILAAGARVTQQSGEQFRRLIQPWQMQSLDVYDQIGEAWYAAQFYARAMSKIRIFAAEIDENGELKEIEDKNDPAVEALDRIRDSSGGRSQFQASWGRLTFLTGETYMTVTQDDDGFELWECLSSDEMRIAPGIGYMRYAAPSVPVEELLNAPDDDFEPVGKGKKTAVVYRLWRRHPRFSLLADAPMRAVLPLFEELELLQQAIRARARSRLSGAGVLLIPTELTFANQPNPGEENDPKKNPVMERIQRAITLAIQQPGSATVVVPVVIQGPGEILQYVKHLRFNDPAEEYQEQATRDQIIRRIATGLDFPQEQLLGMGDANHWTGWLVDDQTWNAHLQPMAQMFVDDMTGVYLQPLLRKLGVEEWDRRAVGFDPADAINHPDRFKDATEMYKEGQINGATWREVGGFNDDNAMKDDEYLTYLALAFNNAQMLPEEFRPELPELAPLEGEGADATVPGDGSEGPPEEAVAQEVEAQNTNGSVTASAMAAVELTGVARATVRRAREMAGSRLRTKARKTDLEPLIASATQTSLIPSLIGEARCAEHGWTASDLVASAGEGFQDCAAEFGLDERVGRRIGLMLEQHSAKTLWESAPAPLPNQLREYLERVL